MSDFLSIICCQIFVIGYCLFFVVINQCCIMFVFVVSYLLSVIIYLLYVFLYQLFVFCCFLSSICCLLFVVNYLFCNVCSVYFSRLLFVFCSSSSFICCQKIVSYCLLSSVRYLYILSIIVCCLSYTLLFAYCLLFCCLWSLSAAVINLSSG